MKTRIVLGSSISLFAMTSLMAWTGCGGSTNSGNPPDATTDGTTESSVLDTGTADTGPADTGSDVQATDASDAADAGSFMSDGAVYCPTTPCPGAQQCCAIAPTFIDGGPDDAGEGGVITLDGGAGGFQCLDQCPDGGAPIACESPTACSGATPVCCADVTLAGSGFACSPASVTSSCVATCADHISIPPMPVCPAMDTVTLCNSSADCPSTYPACCELALVAPFPFCAPSLITKIMGVVCH